MTSMSGLKLSTNASVVIIVTIGAACAAYLTIADSPLAGTVIPVIATLVVGAVVQLLKQQETDSKVEASTAASQHNSDTLAGKAPQETQAVVQGTEAPSQASPDVESRDAPNDKADQTDRRSHCCVADVRT